MDWVKGFALVGILAMPLSAIVATQASAEPDAKTDTMTKSESTTKKAAMSDADKRAKAADCSKKADAKGLHGSEREKFRAACKRK